MWNLTEDNAKVAAAALDQIIISEVVDYKKNPNINLVSLFEKCASMLS